jgi:aminomethyltransferase
VVLGQDFEWSGMSAVLGRHDVTPDVSASVPLEPAPAFKQGRLVVRETSVTWSPTLKRMIGFGSLPPWLAEPGTRVSVEWMVEGEPGKVPGTVVELPFLDLARKRA